MIVPVIPQAGEAGTFESATQDNVIEIGTVIEDGVIEPHEKAVIDEELYQAIAKLQQHSTLVYRVFCAPEKGDARECAAPGAVASNFMEKTNA
ncbi:transcriptional regulator [Salmonella enterica]|nr:transcriptional regulator [Salmonella enterica]ECU8846869.1 transcriptional regulator [Salmonella enterica subsp. enterica serovar Newport]EAP5782859.1 transcriptional regulator [Salmonella enterica]EAT5094755.1 transcriptional regulator [Salmonella enterica]EBE8992891.1 transcriptional regulator [Salmonella enterica]